MQEPSQWRDAMLSIFRMGNLAFRLAMGAIVLGWVAFMASVQAEYQYAKDSVASAEKQQPTSTFANEPYSDVVADPYAYRSDPYATMPEETVTDEVMLESYASGGDWGN